MGDEATSESTDIAVADIRFHASCRGNFLCTPTRKSSGENPFQSRYWQRQTRGPSTPLDESQAARPTSLRMTSPGVWANVMPGVWLLGL